MILANSFLFTSVRAKHVLREAESSDIQPKTKTRSFCRALGLGLFYNAFHRLRHRGRPVFEQRKVALRSDRYYAFLAGCIHFLPMSASVILAALNIAGYYIGGELSGKSGHDSEKFAGLQFASKLHELTINASLAAMVFSYIRQELALGQGVPLGAIFAGLRFQDISVLWSLEFWGTARTTAIGKRRKWVLVILLTVDAFLGVSVGPSSANILKPRLDNWPAGGTDFWVNASTEELWPSVLTEDQVLESCATDTGDLSCPYGSWTTFADNYLSY